MLVVSPEHSLPSNLYKTGIYMAKYYQAMLGQTLTCIQSRQSIHCSRTYTKRVCIYIIFYESLLRQAIACVQSRQSVHCSRPCTNGRTYGIFLTSLSMHAFLSKPSLLSHMHKNGCEYGIFYQSMLRQDLVCDMSRQSSHCSSPLHQMGVHMAYSLSECSVASEHGRSLIRAFAARTLTKCM